MLADMATQIERRARALSWPPPSWGRGRPFAKQAAMAKLLRTDT